MDNKIRCTWVKDAYDKQYHDNEWGKALHDDQRLFELLILEGMQAGLSWNLILKKRAAFREAFDNFNPEKMIRYNFEKIEALLQNEKIIRNRRKIQSAVDNAAIYIKVAEKFGSLDRYLWSYVDYKPIINHWEKHEEVPCETPLSALISRDLRKLGFKFVGPTIIYSFMQASGMVNDHLVCCYTRNDE